MRRPKEAYEASGSRRFCLGAVDEELVEQPLSDIHRTAIHRDGASLGRIFLRVREGDVYVLQSESVDDEVAAERFVIRQPSATAEPRPT